MANISGKVFKKWKPQLNKYLLTFGQLFPELPLLMIDVGSQATVGSDMFKNATCIRKQTE